MCACYTENNNSCLCEDNRVPNSCGSSYQGNSFTSSVIGNPYQGSGYTSSGGNPYQGNSLPSSGGAAYQDIGGRSSYQDFGFPKSNLFLKNYNDTKFSKVVVPSFLTSRVKPKPKAKPKCCPNKKKCCPCKDVGCNTCEPCNFEYPPLCNCCGQLASMPECTPMWSSADVFMNQLNGAQGNRPNPIEPNQSQQRLRPAGLPSKTHAPFDPCTGQELWRQVQPTQQITGPQSMPSPFSMQSINSTFGPNMQFGSGTGCCPCSPWQEMQSTPKQTSSGISLGKSKGKNKNKNSKVNKVKKTKSYTQGKGGDKVLLPKSKRSASADPKQNDICCCCPNSQMASTAKKPTSDYPTKKPPPSKNKPNNKSKRQGNNEVQVVNCCNASPDLMTRICNSLQVPRPPESCYLLLPITMSTKGKDETRQNAKGYNQGDINNDEECDPAAYGRGRPERRSQNECVPRNMRNCACNTEISGNSQDRGNGGGNDNIGDDNNANGSGCGSGCCCWPRRACYYNPYTGRYCWYNNCCCSNGCSNGCNNSTGCCSLPAKEQQSKPNSKQDGSKSSKSQAPPKESPKKDDRFMAGDTGPFQPEGDTWMGYNQYMNNGLNSFLSIPPTGPSPDHTNPLYSSGSIGSPFSQPQEQQQQPPHEQQRALKKEGSRIPSMMMP